MQFLKRLLRIKKWFEEQDEFQFIASSLLFLYDAGLTDVEYEQKECDDELGHSVHRVDVRLIDFAHVQRLKTPQQDEGVLRGIDTIITCFQEILARE